MIAAKKRTAKRRPSGQNLGVQVSLWLPDALADSARAKAAAERYPLSEVIRRLLTLWVKGKVKID